MHLKLLQPLKTIWFFMFFPFQKTFFCFSLRLADLADLASIWGHSAWTGRRAGEEKASAVFAHRNSELENRRTRGRVVFCWFVACIWLLDFYFYFLFGCFFVVFVGGEFFFFFVVFVGGSCIWALRLCGVYFFFGEGSEIYSLKGPIPGVTKVPIAFWKPLST